MGHLVKIPNDTVAWAQTADMSGTAIKMATTIKKYFHWF